MKPTPSHTPFDTSPNPFSNTPSFTVRVDGKDLRFTALACLPLLHSAEGADIAGLTLASSGRNGTCRACICQLVDGQLVDGQLVDGQLVDGQISYRIAWPGLSSDEKRDTLILPCIDHPLSDAVIRLLV